MRLLLPTFCFIMHMYCPASLGPARPLASGCTKASPLAHLQDYYPESLSIMC